ncbi:translocation/assembly module TamB domain-containing protein [Glacieibacterium frigidum]|uniref:translocation/assembly module TamB domain-containing protein n=1 Tax=Glacieibacterium frigidum TaxID=2593303 RepID=UPI001F4314BB|nr:translocation/assembly module TamB domain-containing protein [Glacieibacterium frigidum]
MRRVLLWVAGIVAGLAVLVVALIAGLNTQPGKRFILNQLAGFTSATGLNYRAGRIDGSIYGRMTLRDVEVRDLKGVLATAPAVVVDWSPLPALSQRIEIAEVLVDEAQLLRRPVLGPSDPDEPLLPDIDLKLDRLVVNRLEIAPAVTGRRHVARLSAAIDIADGRAKVTADAAAVQGAGLSGGDTLRLRLDAVPANNRLIVDARLAGPAGGLVDSYAKLGKPLLLTVAGRGSWQAWQGQVAAQAGGAPLADLAVTGRDGIFGVRGRVEPQRLFATGPVASLTDGGVLIDATARLAERRVDLTATAESTAFRANATGLLDLAESRFGNFRVAGQLLRPGAVAPNLAGRDLRFAVVLDGPFGTPALAYDLSATTLVFNGTTVEMLAATGRATIDAERILIPVSARARRVTGLNAAAGGLLTNLRVDGDLAWSNGRLLSDNLRLRSDRLDATAIVVATPATGQYNGALKGRVNDYRVEGLGRVDLLTDARLVSGARGGFGITGSVRVATRQLDNASLREQLGGNAVATARIAYDPAGVARFSALRLTAPRFRITGGEGSYRPDGRIAFQAQGSSTQYGPLSVSGSGTVARPLVRLRAARPNVGVQLNNVVADLEGTAAGYRIKATGGSEYGPFAANVLVRSGAGPLTVDIASARFAGIDFRGSVAQTEAGPFAGRLTLAGSGFNGGVLLASERGVQRATVDVRASAARIPGTVPITIGSGTVRATALLTPGTPSVSGTAYLADLRSGTLLVKRVQSKFDYRAGRGTVGLVASGTAPTPFDIAAQAALTPTRVVGNAKGTLNGIAFRLAAPAVATKTAGGWSLAPATLIVPQGRAVLAGEYGRNSRLRAVLDGIDLAIVETFAPGLGLGGKVSGTIDATQAGGATPAVDANLNIANFTRTAAYTVSAPLDVSTRLRLSGTGAGLDAVVRRGTSVIGRVRAQLAPLGAGASLSQRLLAAPLSGGIRYNGPAELLWALTGIAGQQVSGPVVVAADLGGRVDNPSVTGVVRAATLRYENQAYGTVIRDIALDSRFSRSRLEILSLTGRAGSGTVVARGTIGLDAATGFPLDLNVTLANAQLARGDALGASATGQIAITSSRGVGLIKGTLTIPEARYAIIRQGAAEISELTGVRRKGAPAPTAAAAAPSSQFRLDLRIRADNRIFVSGMGLEAEWRTDMRITGSATAPVVVGKLQIVRGTYSFAGRRFELAQDGAVTFDGGAFTNPQLSLSASTTVDGVSATINIGGRAQRPEITFTSTPALAQDEVLSRLLFGGSITSLSPTQAIQLAAALNSLRGSGGGGLNPLGKLRSASGIDRLRVLGADKTAGRGTALAAGQYISNNIYVEVITDARGFTATQLEIALSRTLSVLSSTSSFGGSNVELRYSKTY